jgi:drug/metabolite transporter (DMT)-like permease
MNWGEAFALASALGWAWAVILLRRSGETLPPFELNLFKNVLGFVLLIPTILIVDGLALPKYSLFDLMIVLTSGLLGIALADTWYLRALNLMGASRTGIVASLFSPFVILLSTVFLGERMVSWQWIGFSLVISGVLLVTWRVHRSEVDADDLRRGSLYGVGAMFMMAVGIVMVKEVLETRPFLWTVELRMVGGIAGMLVVMMFGGRWQRAKQSFTEPQPWGTVIGASFLAAYVALILWLAGYKLIDASVASALNETNGTFIVLLAWLMLGEKIGRRKLVGVSLTLTGVIVMVSMK